MQLFVVGAPRSGTTIVTQALNAHDQIKIFDEVSLIDVLEFGGQVVGKLRAFLEEQGCYEDFCSRVAEGETPATVLCQVMAAVTAPRTIWGEKNPMYATRLGALRGGFSQAHFLFVVRDPREIVNSCLLYRDSSFRSRQDFWIKDSVMDALALVEYCWEPIRTEQTDVSVLRYEQFVARPKATLDAIFSAWQVQFKEEALFNANSAPDTVGNLQFFRRGAPLPWKLANLSPIQSEAPQRGRVDSSDPAWTRVDELAAQFGYV
jgi:hypothetical protein